MRRHPAWHKLPNEPVVGPAADERLLEYLSMADAQLASVSVRAHEPIVRSERQREERFAFGMFEVERSSEAGS